MCIMAWMLVQDGMFPELTENIISWVVFPKGIAAQTSLLNGRTSITMNFAMYEQFWLDKNGNCY